MDEASVRARKCEISKRSRQKRSKEVHELEMQVTKLREQNRQLMIRCTKGLSQRSKEAEANRVTLLNKLTALVNSGASEYDVKLLLQEYTDRYADFSVERGQKIKFHLAQLKELLNPTEVSKIFFTLMDYWESEKSPPPPELASATTPVPAASSSSSTSSSSPAKKIKLVKEEESSEDDAVGQIWEKIVKDVGLSPEQKQDFMNLGPETRTQEITRRKAYEIMQNLDAFNAGKNHSMKAKIDQIASFIEPSQMVLFLKFIEEKKELLQSINDEWIEDDRKKLTVPEL